MKADRLRPNITGQRYSRNNNAYWPTIGPVLNEIALVMSGLGVGGLLGAVAKSALDKRHLKFSKVFEYKEARYKAITILMWVAMNPAEHELEQLKLRRPEIDTFEKLDRELELEYHNAMLYSSRKVLKRLKAFLAEKNLGNWQAVTGAMKKDLYL